VDQAKVLQRLEKTTRKVTDWRAVEEEQAGDPPSDADEAEMEPFHLKDDAKLGKFDEQGNFTWTRRDLEEDEDKAWLEQVGTEVAARPFTSQSREMAPPSREERLHVISTLVELLAKGESSLQALRRFKDDKTAISSITEACEVLIGDQENVYILKREQLAALLPQMQWQYRVIGSDDVYGPFMGEEMQSWREDGFFTAESQDLCEVRLIGSNKWLDASAVANFLWYNH